MQGSARIDELRQKFHENPRRYFAPLANEYRKAGDPEQAIAICRAHLAQQPGHMSGHVVYAQSLYDAGRIDESRVVFEKALSLDPDNAIVLRQLGDISRQRGDSGEARHWYSRALEADPHDREIAAYIAELTEPLTETDALPEVEAAQAPESAVEPAIETPVAEEAADEEPAETERAEDEPAEEEPAEEKPAEEEPAEDEPAEEEPADEEPAEEEPLAAIELGTDEAVAEPGSEATPLAWELADEARDGEGDLAPPEADVEVPMTEPAIEPESPAPSDETTVEPDETVTGTAPLTTASPFVTRTMADLYARQGYHQQALEVYRELAVASPDDAELADRIRELGAIAEGLSTPDELSSEVDTDTEQPEAISPVSEAVNEFGEPDDHESDLGFRLQDETVAPTPETDGVAGDHHFTETEIGAGDQWDTDPWGAGFSSDDEDVVTFDFNPSNASPEGSEEFQLENPPGLGEATIPPVESHDENEESADAAEPVANVVETSEPEVAAAPEAVTESENIAEHDVTTELEKEAAAEVTVASEPPPEQDVLAEAELAAAPLPLGVLNDAREEISVEEMFAFAASSSPDAEDAPGAHDDAVVAYSPQTPDEKDLVHYTPTGPTVSEFFATLGAYRPPAHDAQPSFTARAAVPEMPALAEPDESESDEIWSPAAPEPAADPTPEPDLFPLASEAFANLFPDSPISEEDSKAAFALSGALSSQPAGTPHATPPKPVPPTIAESPAPASGTQESEEDIRRFREWLDGLAES